MKGEISITVVIMIVIALLVLAILAAVLLKGGRGLSGVGVDCAAHGGHCTDRDSCIAEQGQPIAVGGIGNDCANQNVCCKATGTKPATP
ncbi:MAG: hypothetical protein ABIA93_02805 [Candidatus Woesearchaeota archaeon]